MNGQPNETALRQLTAPTRNHYFYGKLLDELHFRMEQDYGNRKRWLLNRLGLGAGVLCGLGVEVTEDGRCVLVRSGVAIDALGREVIVPQDYCLEDPRQPTDDRGRPEGDRITGEGEVTLCLAYHECPAEPAPVLVGDCDRQQACAPSVIRERYRLLVRRGQPEARPGSLTTEQCAALFPEAPDDDFDRRLAACETIDASCAAPDGTCVVLGTVALPAEEDDSIAVDTCTYRQVVYSNAVLLDLILCLAARVDACCRGLTLDLVSGDDQTAEPGEELEEPLVVEVAEDDGDVVAGEEVTFVVQSGGGTVDPEAVTTDANGRAETRWTLGPAEGQQTLEASIASGSRVRFRARAEADDIVDPPVVRALWPPQARVLTPGDDDQGFEQWVERPRLEVTFNREMDEDDLREPDPWLRLWQVRSFGQNEIRVQRLPLLVVEPNSAPILEPEVDEFTFVYDLDSGTVDELTGARYLVQIRAEGDAIVDTNTPPLLLDAEFRGTRLSDELLDRIWGTEGPAPFGQEVWDALVDTGDQLPQSGEGTEGGRFHGWFEVEESLI